MPAQHSPSRASRSRRRRNRFFQANQSDWDAVAACDHDPEFERWIKQFQAPGFKPVDYRSSGSHPSTGAKSSKPTPKDVAASEAAIEKHPLDDLERTEELDAWLKQSKAAGRVSHTDAGTSRSTRRKAADFEAAVEKHPLDDLEWTEELKAWLRQFQHADRVPHNDTENLTSTAKKAAGPKPAEAKHPLDDLEMPEFDAFTKQHRSAGFLFQSNPTASTPLSTPAAASAAPAPDPLLRSADTKKADKVPSPQAGAPAADIDEPSRNGTQASRATTMTTRQHEESEQDDGPSDNECIDEVVFKGRQAAERRA